MDQHVKNIFMTNHFIDGGSEPTIIEYVTRGPAVPTSVTVCGGSSINDPYIFGRLDTTGNLLPKTIEVGNKFYNGTSGSDPFNGNNLYYILEYTIAEISNTKYLCQIGTGVNAGVILDIYSTCVE